MIPISNQDGHQAKNRKKGDEIKRKSSPLKLLSKYQPSFAEMILEWSPSKMVSDISDLRPRWPAQPNLILHRTLIWWNGPWMAPFQNCVRWSLLPTKMAAKLKNLEKGDGIIKNLLHWNYWTNRNQTLVEWSLGGPLPKLCLVIPTSNQGGRQAKNRKKGGWNFNCPLLL